MIDHSIQVDVFAERLAFQRNAELEFERNRERYAFLRWGKTAFENFAVVPPNTGICHQVNLEYLARVVETRDGQAFPDTLVGTDSHTTMVNGLGVLGWGVGGIEAEAAMLGQPVSMLIPQVVGFRLEGELPEGATATDLVLTVTEMLRERGVVGKFVEFFGPGLPNLPLADRATIGNMSPEMGATCAIFPVDAETLRYLEFSGRPRERVELVEAYCREQGLFHDADAEESIYSDTLELDLSTVEPSLAGPRRPQDRVALSNAASDFRSELGELIGEAVQHEPPAGSVEESSEESFPASDPPSPSVTDGASAPGHQHHTAVAEPPWQRVPVTLADGTEFELDHGAVVIAAITSCTNTSNPAVMLGAGLLAKKAVELRAGPAALGQDEPRAGLEGRDRLPRARGADRAAGAARLQPRGLRLHHLHRELGAARRGDLEGGAGQRPGRLLGAVRQPELRGAHPPRGEDELPRLAAALRGLRARRPHGPGRGHRPAPGRRPPARHLAQPARGERRHRAGDRVRHVPAQLRRGVRGRRDLELAAGAGGRSLRLGPPSPPTSSARPTSRACPRSPPSTFEPIEGARALALLGDSVTTDHISPAGAIKKDSPAGRYLIERGVEPRGFNSYGSRRGNHEVMMRGTFANVRLRNQLAPGTEGGVTVKDGEETSIYDAAMAYAEEGVPLCVLAGKEYGSGSSRDWAAKGPRLLGVRFALAESYERIHRSNLVGMGVLPLQFPDGESVESLGLTGFERFDLDAARGRRAHAEGDRHAR